MSQPLVLLLFFLASCGDGPEKIPSQNQPSNNSGVPPDKTVASNSFCKVQEIFESNCIGCHSANGQRPALTKALASSALVNKQNAQGNYLVKAGSSTTSELYKRVSSTDAAFRMPHNAPALSTVDIQTIKTWIDSGASTACP